VARVDEVGICNASCTEVPIWTIKALVTYTINVLVASIADSIVANVAAWGEKGLGNQVEVCILYSRLEGVLWVMTMLVTDVA
jgi:hypothetical protein